jgi:hypothetical protein
MERRGMHRSQGRQKEGIQAALRESLPGIPLPQICKWSYEGFCGRWSSQAVSILLSFWQKWQIFYPQAFLQPQRCTFS